MAKRTNKNQVYFTVQIEPKYFVDAAKTHIETVVLHKFGVRANGETKNIIVVIHSPKMS